MTALADPLANRVLVFAPRGRDGELATRILHRAGVEVEALPSIGALCSAIRQGAAAAVLTEESLSDNASEELGVALAAQPSWSDLPIVLCTTGGDVTRASALRVRLLEELGNVMVVERPMQTRTLVAAVHAGLRARRRQFELRDVVTALEGAVDERATLLTRAQAARADAEEANRAKDEFLAMISHELRTPLNAILGWSRMMAAGKLEPPQQERAVQTIERNAVAQAKLIDELLDVSRIISRTLRLSRRHVDFRTILDAAVDALRPQAESKGLAISTATPPTPVRTFADAERLTQVVSNLLANAVKFTPAGGTIEVGLAVDDGSAQLSVKDDGIGIRAEFLDYVFDRFRQADGSRTRSHGGLGLGLAIVRQLVELHGGSAAVASAGVGRGATFTVRLPIVRDGEVGLRQASERPPPMAPDVLRGVRVVVVDDELDARELVTAVLELAGAVVTSVGSAEEAMLAFRESPPSLIVSDIGMPGEDGYALISRIRALSPEKGGRVPAIAVTAFTRPEDRGRALRAGYTAHVGKPIDPAELVTLVTNVTTHTSGLARGDDRSG